MYSPTFPGGCSLTGPLCYLLSRSPLWGHGRCLNPFLDPFSAVPGTCRPRGTGYTLGRTARASAAECLLGRMRLTRAVARLKQSIYFHVQRRWAQASTSWWRRVRSRRPRLYVSTKQHFGAIHMPPKIPQQTPAAAGTEVKSRRAALAPPDKPAGPPRCEVEPGTGMSSEEADPTYKPLIRPVAWYEDRG
ncbi:hypothetical protein GQ53DRAFT_504487 [Thozetella sp. PMI_491]|nr:hypothetical protein GQ53DRAFT_504487 [Thozetella sp. PMI_491]